MKRLWLLLTLAAFGGVAAYALISPDESTLASYSTELEGRTSSQRHNAETAIIKLKNVTLQPGEVFSFNRTTGSFSRDAGYRKAPVSYNGQLISSFGGGVCQVSTTLYNAALLSGLEIVERNRHRFAPKYVPPGRDAAVAYDTIDLKLRNPYRVPVRIEGEIDSRLIKFKIVGAIRLESRPQIVQEVKQIREPETYRIRGYGRSGRIRNSGKMGCSVVTYRVINGHRERISNDDYPSMSRVIEYR